MTCATCGSSVMLAANLVPEADEERVRAVLTAAVDGRPLEVEAQAA